MLRSRTVSFSSKYWHSDDENYLGSLKDHLCFLVLELIYKVNLELSVFLVHQGF